MFSSLKTVIIVFGKEYKTNMLAKLMDKISKTGGPMAYISYAHGFPPCHSP
jgi:uncharacterized protein YdaL